MTWLRYAGSLTDSLDDAQQWLARNKRAGAICPCCEQPTKVYKRKLNSSMAYVLVQMYHRFQRDTSWLHVPGFLNQISIPASLGAAVRGGDWAKLRYWGLIIPKAATRPDGSNRSGYYKITDVGIAFVEQRWQLPQHVLLFNQEAFGFEGPDVIITDVVRDKFNYQQLMAA